MHVDNTSLPASHLPSSSRRVLHRQLKHTSHPNFFSWFYQHERRWCFTQQSHEFPNATIQGSWQSTGTEWRFRLANKSQQCEYYLIEVICCNWLLLSQSLEINNLKSEGNRLFISHVMKDWQYQSILWQGHIKVVDHKISQPMSWFKNTMTVSL